MASDVQGADADDAELRSPPRRFGGIAALVRENPLAKAGPGLPILLNQLFNSAANFVVTVLLLRLLGLAEFGHYTLYYVVALSTISILASLVTSPAVSIAATLSSERRREVLTAAGASIVGGVAVIVAVLGVAELLRLDARLHVGPFAAMLAAVALSEQARRILLFSRRIVLAWAFDLLRYGTLIILLLTAMGDHYDAPSAMLAIAAAFTPALAVLAALLLVHRHIMSFANFLPHARRVLTNGRWLASSALLDIVNNNSFLFVGSVALGTEAAGIVRAATSVAGLIHPLVQTTEHLLPRHIGDLVARQGWSSGLRRYLRDSTWAAIAIVLSLCLISIFAGSLLTFVAGRDMHGYAWVLQGVALSWVPYLVGIFLAFPLRALERSDIIAASFAVSAAVSLLIAYPLVAGLGLAGIVIGTILSSLLSASALVVAFARLRKELAR